MENTRLTVTSGRNSLETIGALLLVAFLLACGGFVYLMSIVM